MEKEKSSTIIAVVELNKNQYRLSVGDMVDVDYMADAKEGDIVSSDKVLLYSSDGSILVGKPYIDLKKIDFEVVSHMKADKIRVFKYKAKARYRRHVGHRQKYTQLKVLSIV